MQVDRRNTNVATLSFLQSEFVAIKRDVGIPLLQLNGFFILALDFKTYEHREPIKQPNSGL